MNTSSADENVQELRPTAQHQTADIPAQRPATEGGGGCPMGRRGFLQTLGVGAAASAASTFSPGAAGTAAATPGHRSAPGFGYQPMFDRLFPRLEPFAMAGPALTEALLDIGRPGGVLDANDDLSAGPIRLITDLSLSENNPNSSHQSAGSTFMGQFLAHDMTFDVGSNLGSATEPEASRNGRTPMLDLDSVYGSGPAASPQLYSAHDRAKLRIESGGAFEDLPRAGDGSAIIADPRNDENLVLAGLQCAFIKFHNNAVDSLRSGGVRRAGDFAEARRLTTWHYQWLLVHEFLPQFVGPAMVDNVLRRGRRFYQPGAGAGMPIEFQGAAFRFGHSMIRPSYRANLAGNPDGSPFFGFLFDTTAAPTADPNDLSGGCRSARRFIGWQTFFDFGDGNVKPNKAIDTTLSTPLFHLPLGSIASGDHPTVLPQRTLLRHVTWSMPSGQAIARTMRLETLGAEAFPELAGYGLGLEASTPLFYYLLKEAELLEGGRQLGPVGGRIVAEVLLGLLQLDAASYLNAAPSWRPTMPTRSESVTGDFRMVDFLTFAGVDPTSRGQ